MEKDIKQTIDYKDAKIRANMDAKEEGIFISGSSRDATLILTTFYPELVKIKDVKDQEAKIKQAWETWQKYFYDHMKSKMPEMPACPTCSGAMKISSKGNWYCPNFTDERHQCKPRLTSHEQAFANSLR